ncbi:hypothetical protein L1049_023069 [Liquidambar formosana]|uniref:Uncharacterized protein n=1 Tax=Liquidambar formosana TaxID=63359 RepID=A0AAP0WPS4_LIQFO
MRGAVLRQNRRSFWKKTEGPILLFFEGFKGKMVLIMLNGKLCTMEDLKPPMECITKVVEDEQNEQGRPRVKIVYIDPLDWSYRAEKMIFEHRTMIQEVELEKAEELNEQAKPGEDFEPPRLIFVMQAQEYWPGSESNPEAMATCASKDKVFRETGCHPFGRAFDYKRLTVATYVKCSGYGYIVHQDYFQCFNPNFPGYRFIIENYPESEGERWRE